MKKTLAVILLLMAFPVYATDYYVDITTGSDADDGLSEGNAWQHLAKAADIVTAGTTVYVKASAVYETEDGANNCVMQTSADGAVDSPITFIGYTSIITDGGQVTVNADPMGDQFASAIDGTASGSYHIWKNFIFTGGSSHGYNGGESDWCVFYNCRFTSNGGSGLLIDNWCLYYLCSFDTNTSSGIVSDSISRIFASKAYANGSYGMDLDGGEVLSSLVYGNGSDAICFSQAERDMVYGCTIDSENANNGILFNTAGRVVPTVIINNIIYDANVGVNSAVAQSFDFALANLINSNITDYTNFPAGIDDVTGAPLFTNEAADDYTLSATSPAIDAGSRESAPDRDVIGTSRPQGKAVDVGAYEHPAK